MEIYTAMTEKQRSEWHRRNDPKDDSKEVYSPNKTYQKAINYK